MEGNKKYSPDAAIRKSTLHWVGDRLGNISVPILSRYADHLVGYDILNGAYSYENKGGIMKLTIRAGIQTVALEAMGSKAGTVAVYNYETGEILCAVSTPTFDPENVPDIAGDQTGAYEGVYVNRFLKSVYVPGSIYKIVTAAAALETVPDIFRWSFTCTGTYETGDGDVTCEGVHGTQDLKAAFRNSCNCAFAKLTQTIGRETMTHYAQKFGLTESISFDGIRTAPGNYSVMESSEEALAWSGIGQYTDQINPCRFLTFMGAIANGGAAVEPHLVKEVTCDGKLTYQASPVVGDAILPAEIAQELQTMMRNNVLEKYGPENFPAGMTVCGKSGTGQVGGNKKSNAMFCGFVTDEAYPLAFIASVEDAGYGRFVCVPILSEVLAACKEMMDA
jgi:peptidoglycan glycosyltransferase